MPIGRTVALLLGMAILVSCQEADSGTIESNTEARPNDTGVPTFEAPEAPPANFADMSDYDYAGGSDSAFVAGTLRIDAPCVYVFLSEKDIVLGKNSEPLLPIRYQLNLPRSGTFFDSQRDAIWAWDEGPMLDGDRVIAAGGEGSFSSPDCPLAYRSWSTAGLLKVADTAD